MATAIVSDKTFEFHCSGCQRDGVNHEAADYCKACRTFFCEKCLSYHNKFKCLKSHNDKLVGREKFNAITKQRSPTEDAHHSFDTMFSCNACASVDTYNDAIDYCHACKEFFCSICLSNHTRWKQSHTDQMFGTEDLFTMMELSKSRTTMPPELPARQSQNNERENNKVELGQDNRRTTLPPAIPARHSQKNERENRKIELGQDNRRTTLPPDIPAIQSQKNERENRKIERGQDNRRATLPPGIGLSAIQSQKNERENRRLELGQNNRRPLHYDKEEKLLRKTSTMSLAPCDLELLRGSDSEDKETENMHEPREPVDVNDASHRENEERSEALPVRVSQEKFHLTCNGCRQDGIKTEAEDYCKDCKQFFCAHCLRVHNRLPDLKSHHAELIGREHLKNIAESRNILTTVNAADDNFNTNCDGCQQDERKTVAVIYCKVCMEFFCEGCVKYHNKIPSLDPHKDKLVRRENVPNVRRPRKSRIQSVDTKFNCSSCAKGLVNKPSIEYCFTCGEFLCDVCLGNHERWADTHRNTMLRQDDLKAMIRASKRTGNSPTRQAVLMVPSKNADTESSLTDLQLSVKEDHSEGATAASSHVAEASSSVSAAARKSTEENVIKVEIREVTENDVCEAVGACSLPDGGWLVADSTNKVLKKFDKNNRITDRCKLPDRPLDVCYIVSTNAAAVAMAKKTVAIVLLAGGMSCSHEIKMPFMPHGIASALKFLYVVRYQGKEIFEYKLKGKLNKKISPSAHRSSSAAEQKPMSKMSKISGLTVSEDGQCLFVTDIRGLFILDTKRATILHAISFNDPQSVSLGDDDSLFLCLRDGIIQLDRDGANWRSVLTPGTYEGCSPVAICYQSETARLLVMMAKELEGFDYMYLMKMN